MMVEEDLGTLGTIGYSGLAPFVYSLIPIACLPTAVERSRY